MEVERSLGVHRRWFERLDAGHTQKSTDVSAATNASPRTRFPTARITVLLSLATGACHDLEIAPYKGKGTGEKSLFRRMYDTLKPGDVVLADALFDDYFIVWELCKRKVDIVARVQHERVGAGQ